MLQNSLFIASFFHTGLFFLFYLPFMASVKAQSVEWFLTPKPYMNPKELLYEDMVYESSFRTVVLYPDTGNPDASLSPPIIPLEQPYPLILEFDEIGEEAGYYEASIEHCNHDWSRSGLRPVEYLSVYNEFPIQEFIFSINTKVNYTHFWLELPRVKISGNYLLKVYREGKDKDLILTRRFVVYESSSIIQAQLEPVLGTEVSQRRQQVTFTANYGRQILENPQQSVKAVIRQDFRWDQSIKSIPPLFVRENQSLLEFTYFDLEHTFPGGNEYRHFDFRGFNTGGFNVDKMRILPTVNQVILFADKPWSGRVYNQQRRDHDGQFFIDNYEAQGDPRTEADYATVDFTLASENPYKGDVYVLGVFNHWQLFEEYQLEYVPELAAYKGRLFLKQGVYDYTYTIYQPNEQLRNDQLVDGNHSRTQHVYDIILYYRPMGSRGDRVIGYAQVNGR